MNNFKIKDLVDIAIVTGLYIALTIMNPLSYQSFQFRISEALVLLCFFNKKYIYALVVGVFISNFFNAEFMVLDVIFGTVSTLIGSILCYKSKNLFVASLYPTISSILVVIEIYIYTKLPIYFIAIEVIGSMFIILSLIGYPIFKILSKNKGFLKLIDSKKEGFKYEV